MRLTFAFLLLVALSVSAAEKESYGIPLDTKTYPQATAKEALTLAAAKLPVKTRFIERIAEW